MIMPGLTSLTVIPSAASLSAYNVVSIEIPALETQYSPRLVLETAAEQLEILTIAPLFPALLYSSFR